MKKNFPTLYAKASTGKIKVWRIWAEQEGSEAKVVTQYGWKGSDNQQTTAVKISQGKNIGRSNETTAFEQACLEAEAKWTKKQDKKYTTNPSGESDALLPMLAHDYKKRHKAITWPAYIQPKLNGIRCLSTKVSETEMRYLSRGGKEFTTLDHFTPILLERLAVGETLDGELFNEELTFQEIVSAVKRKQDLTEIIQYWVYDMVLDGVPFEKRIERVRKVCDQGHQGSLTIIPVWTLLCKNEKEMLNHHSRHVELGLEGTMIRNAKGLYRKDFRSSDLQKYKDMVEEEFRIVGAKEGVGRAEGSVTWTCVNEDGKEFDVRPRGTQEQRAIWWTNREKYIGKMLTVRYQNRSDENIPIFPVGINIREGTVTKDGAFKPDL